MDSTKRRIGSSNDRLQSVEDLFDRFGISNANPREPLSDQILAELMQIPYHRHMLFNSYCINNGLSRVTSFLKTYKGDPFVSCRDNSSVDSVALAVVEGHDRIIRFLYTKDDGLNNNNTDGRTPLVESATLGATEGRRVSA